jgi:DNA (cytosine-5)-methyltransferase 3A
MNVLSLFDGCSCGQLALKRANIPYDKYYASEIDKYAIKIAKKNFPNSVHIGDIRIINNSSLDLDKIDLLIGGSPCQGFSFAKNDRLNFNDPRSQLFFEYVRLLKECKPKYFLLENVVMNQKCQDVISDILEVKPHKINSSILSAQNRKRLYWTNIPFDVNKLHENDKKLVISDIIDPKADAAPVPVNERNKRHLRDITQKSLCCTATMYKGAGNNGCTLIEVGKANVNGHDILKRVYAREGKSPTINTCGGGNREPKVIHTSSTWRKLSVIECERLQTLPDNYTEGVSNTQRYKMIGNGWTVDIISYIFQGIK